jgi:hypothetical protein
MSCASELMRGILTFARDLFSLRGRIPAVAWAGLAAA